MTSRRRTLARLLAAALLTLALAPAAALAAPRPRVSFTDAQQLFMCVVCHEALGVARSPEAYNENGYLRTLIARGETKPQIVQDMVGQYGEAVLAQPPDHGFGSLVYVVPGAVVAVSVLTLGLVLPRWRRRSRAQAQARAGAPVPAALDAEDARRLDAELARRG